MEEERRRFIEDFGLMFEQFGASRMVWRVVAALLIADPQEQSAEELAETLQASRGSISQATRLLIELGVVRRTTRPGERRDYFSIKPHVWPELMRREMAELSRFRELASRGLTITDLAGPESRTNLEEMRDFYTFWERELPTLLEKWEAGRLQQS